jgi:hypothetical protein
MIQGKGFDMISYSNEKNERYPTRHMESGKGMDYGHPVGDIAIQIYDTILIAGPNHNSTTISLI